MSLRKPGDEQCGHVVPDLKVFQESLLLAIHTGRVEEVRAILLSLSEDDSPQERVAGIRRKNLAKLCCGIEDAASAEEAGNAEDRGKQNWEKKRRLVNSICPRSQKSALYLAVELGGLEVAEELLNHGADADFEWSYPSGAARDERIAWTKCCLDVAVVGGSIEMVEALIAAGAKVKSSTWRCLIFLQHPLKAKVKPKIMDALHTRGKAPVPISVAIDLATDKAPFVEGGPPNVMMDVLKNARWYFSDNLDFNYTLVQSQHLQPNAQYLLRRRAVGLVQHYSKCYFLQWLLVAVLQRDSWLCAAPESLLAMVLEEGASVHGWTNKHAMVMQRAWEYLQLYPESWEKDIISEGCATGMTDMRYLPSSYEVDLAWSACQSCVTSLLEPLGLSTRIKHHRVGVVDMPHQSETSSRNTSSEEYVHSMSSPCILPAVRVHASMSKNRSASLMETVLSRTKVKWLEDPSRIPVFGDDGTSRQLHNGPTCSDHVDLSAEQKKVSLAMCTCSGSTVQSLMSLCRDVITTACLEHTENVFFAVENLPLPSRLKCFMLGS